MTFGEACVFPLSVGACPTDVERSREVNLNASARLPEFGEDETVAEQSSLAAMVGETLLKGWLEDEGKSLVFDSENPRDLRGGDPRAQSDIDFCIGKPSSCSVPSADKGQIEERRDKRGEGVMKEDGVLKVEEEIYQESSNNDVLDIHKINFSWFHCLPGERVPDANNIPLLGIRGRQIKHCGLQLTEEIARHRC
ncbi:hypothetical protein AGABI2DRAFT_121591 [Agaricus bisporus var. bisporus H97]|uniref:hypothetical protein n=1 Tax=Agaricus bisporus var. bisporus (strain H97 / ATCC MYA-4626 / FGSC 10389) TaxID=936046 RepID=UPI00029F7530|nr:hypothetical protein AGABI2DRAFT_121591 [Agaricus bisporus var. bisporus H97]EKV43470.1 hypothetical protein AGABI2DRAFT_121591 [Agaricus bisporus var. bisporus H97]